MEWILINGLIMGFGIGYLTNAIFHHKETKDKGEYVEQ